MKKMIMVWVMVIGCVLSVMAQNRLLDALKQHPIKFANGRKVGEKWTEYHGDSENIMEQQKDGSVKRSFVLKCMSCLETGKCKLCNGQGGSSWYSSYYGRWINQQCMSCAGRGTCSLCGGDGKTEHSLDIAYPIVNFPNMVTHSGCWIWYDYYIGPSCNSKPNSNVSNNMTNGNSNYSNSGVYNNNSNNTRTCYKCKGSGMCESGNCYHGQCIQCNGSGYCYYDYGQYIGCNASHEKAQQCTKCYGRGYCPTCSGSGITAKATPS